MGPPEAKLTFGELEEGDKFIGFPLPGDNEGHGGYRGTHYVFIKIPLSEGYAFPYNAIRMTDGMSSQFPDSSFVVKVE